MLMLMEPARRMKMRWRRVRERVRSSFLPFFSSVLCCPLSWRVLNSGSYVFGSLTTMTMGCVDSGIGGNLLARAHKGMST